MSNLFDLNNVLKQMHDTVIDVFEFNEMDFKTRICENSCSVYCDQITDEDYERKLGNEGYIEFKYSHENGLELIVTLSVDKSAEFGMKLPKVLAQEIAPYPLKHTISEYIPGETSVNFVVKPDINSEDQISTYTDILAWLLVNISMAI